MTNRALLLRVMVCGLLSSLAGCKENAKPVARPTTFTMAVREDGEAPVDPKAGEILQWSSPAPDYPSFELRFLGYDPCSESGGRQEANGQQQVYRGSQGNPVICHITAAGNYLYDLQTTPAATPPGNSLATAPGRVGQIHRFAHVGTCKYCLKHGVATQNVTVLDISCQNNTPVLADPAAAQVAVRVGSVLEWEPLGPEGSTVQSGPTGPTGGAVFQSGPTPCSEAGNSLTECTVKPTAAHRAFSYKVTHSDCPKPGTPAGVTVGAPIQNGAQVIVQ
jgi:hypothetical protein